MTDEELVAEIRQAVADLLLSKEFVERTAEAISNAPISTDVRTVETET
jgi:hypothetical protein